MKESNDDGKDSERKIKERKDDKEIAVFFEVEGVLEVAVPKNNI